MRNRGRPTLSVLGLIFGLLLALIYVLLCFGCASGGQFHKSYTVYRAELDPDPGYAGYIMFREGLILIDDDVAPYMWNLVIRAELMHAGGVLTEPDPYTLDGHYSVDAVAKVAETTFPVYLTPSEDLYQDTVIAAAWWNDQLGYERYFVLR